MEPTDLRRLIKFISTDRFARYESAAGGDADMAMQLYAWNIAVSSAFLGRSRCWRWRYATRCTKHWWRASAGKTGGTPGR